MKIGLTVTSNRSMLNDDMSARCWRSLEIQLHEQFAEVFLELICLDLCLRLNSLFMPELSESKRTMYLPRHMPYVPMK
jgi:hypothetical protein